MTTGQLLVAFSDILRDLLLDDTIVLNMETRREDVPDWDSFNYINFIVAIEVQYGIKFKIADVESFANVGAIVTETARLLSLRNS
ncbi:MAG TPA: acyl carrier protein [Acetobacteraceae bacterium]|jgi:acyl carrier protein|nr:acyl carrier protein [Acetobacteraceae bacterium]